MRIAHILSRLPDEYRVYNDVYLENNGHTAQIDHVIISSHGIYIIETKNYSGKIYGSENAEYWTQYLRGNGYEFRNPILQNQSHIIAIKNTLHIDSTHIVPIIVFLDKADLRCQTTSIVIYANQLYDYILNHKEIVFSFQELDNIGQKLSTSIITAPDRKETHIQDVRQNIAEREQQIENLICPRCKGVLVERQGKFGRFLGCSNYPHCKFSRPL